MKKWEKLTSANSMSFLGKNAYQVDGAWAWLRMPIETQRVTNCQQVYELHGRYDMHEIRHTR